MGRRSMKIISEKGNSLYRKITTSEFDGIGVIEIILILVIIIGLVLIFKNQIVAIVTKAFESITGNATQIQTDIAIK